MCHLVFLVPLAGVPLFWFIPLGYALPLNVVLWVVSSIFGYQVVKAMMSPKDGFKSLIGKEAVVVSADSQGHGNYLIKTGHELWTARSTETLRAGEKVEVAATDGIKLVVKRAGLNTGVRQNERHRH